MVKRCFQNCRSAPDSPRQWLTAGVPEQPGSREASSSRALSVRRKKKRKKEGPSVRSLWISSRGRDRNGVGDRGRLGLNTKSHYGGESISGNVRKRFRTTFTARPIRFYGKAPNNVFTMIFMLTLLRGLIETVDSRRPSLIQVYENIYIGRTLGFYSVRK